MTVDLKAGAERATVWTNDLTHAYVHENSAYIAHEPTMTERPARSGPDPAQGGHPGRRRCRG